MKILICFIALIALACAIDDDDIKAAVERKEFLERIVVECGKETGFDLVDGNKLLLGDLSIRTHKAQCFVRCVFKKEGFLNEKDEPQIEYIVDSIAGSVKLKRKVLSKLISKCSKRALEGENKNPCALAFKLLECYMTNKAIVKNVSDEL